MKSISPLGAGRAISGIVLLCALCSSGALADVKVPALDRRVTDLTSTLTPDQLASLESRLAAFERRKGSQVAVLVVPTTQPETIEQYSIRVVDQWKLGRKGTDDGVLLLVAKNDRKMRIEVGYGLEGVLPDIIAKRIADETIAPHFKQNNFHAGIAAGVDRILRTVDGEKLPAPPKPPVSDEFKLSVPVVLGAIFLLVVLRLLVGPAIGVAFASVGAFIGYFADSWSWMLFAFALLLPGILMSLTWSRRSGWVCTFPLPTNAGGGSGSAGSGGFSGGGGGFGGAFPCAGRTRQ